MQRVDRHKSTASAGSIVFAELLRKCFLVHDHNKMTQRAATKYEVSRQANQHFASENEERVSTERVK